MMRKYQITNNCHVAVKMMVMQEMVSYHTKLMMLVGMKKDHALSVTRTIGKIRNVVRSVMVRVCIMTIQKRQRYTRGHTKWVMIHMDMTDTVLLAPVILNTIETSCTSQ